VPAYLPFQAPLIKETRKTSKEAKEEPKMERAVTSQSRLCERFRMGIPPQEIRTKKAEKILRDLLYGAQ